MSSYGAKGARTPDNRLQRAAPEPEHSLAWRRAAMAGYSIWQVKSMQVAIAWAKCCPLIDSEGEIRPIFTYSPEEVSDIVSQAK